MRNSKHHANSMLLLNYYNVKEISSSYMHYSVCLYIVVQSPRS